MNTNTASTVGFFVIGLIVALIIFMPLAVIWSINTLFGMGIDYSFLNWLAILILGSFIRATPTVTTTRK